MATVSERSKELAGKLDLLCRRVACQPCGGMIAEIEQALLAERRLAMEEAGTAIADSKKLSERDKIIACVAIRTAVSELDGPRGGE